MTMGRCVAGDVSMVAMFAMAPGRSGLATRKCIDAKACGKYGEGNRLRNAKDPPRPPRRTPENSSKKPRNRSPVCPGSLALSRGDEYLNLQRR